MKRKIFNVLANSAMMRAFIAKPSPKWMVLLADLLLIAFTGLWQPSYLLGFIHIFTTGACNLRISYLCGPGRQSRYEPLYHSSVCDRRHIQTCAAHCVCISASFGCLNHKLLRFRFLLFQYLEYIYYRCDVFHTDAAYAAGYKIYLSSAV